MMSTTHFVSARILYLLTVLTFAATTTAVETSLNTTDATASNGSLANIPNDNFFDIISPDNSTSELSGDESIFDTADMYNSTASAVTKYNTTISDIIVSSPEMSNHSTDTASASRSNAMYNTTKHFQEPTTPIPDTTTSQIPLSTTTLATPSVEDADSLKTEVESLRIAVIVVSIIAGLGVICIIILVAWLITQKRKQKNSDTEASMEMSRQRHSQDGKWPEVTRMSSSDNINSDSSADGRYRTVTGKEAGPKSADTASFPDNYNLEPIYRNIGISTFTPGEDFQYNSQDAKAKYSQDNEYVNAGELNNDVYTNLRDGLNQTTSPTSGHDSNTHLPNSSEDVGIYSNYKNG